MIDTSREARIILATGRTGTGKSHFIRECIRADRPNRLIIFDPDGEHGDIAHQVDTLRDLLHCVAGRRFAVAFRCHIDPGPAAVEFDAVCRMAWDLCSAGPVALYVDELAHVTSPSKAPPTWARCVTRGRKHGLTIYAASQRPAAIDKTIFSNASTIRTGSLRYPVDQQVMAEAIGVPRADVAALAGHQWIMADDAGTVTRG